jgi:hypothetical protein
MKHFTPKPMIRSEPLHCMQARGLVKKAEDGDNVVANLKAAAQIYHDWGMIDQYLKCLLRLSGYYMHHNYLNDETLSVLMKIQRIYAQNLRYNHRLVKHDKLIQEFKYLVQMARTNGLTETNGQLITGGSHSTIPP